ncbi:hypothetical protein [Legionella clemsonensis]|uniref:Uncharacterized protein n=1 Tax=Legionella clemsonensis TaxID=1867846 RepID=A0A222P2D4_9GAMM|nr:hypothetical protein [Legionella clemsonensis]ASQ46002.1 hypothetical protein clem_07245 [Legionella clemsonensis]
MAKDEKNQEQEKTHKREAEEQLKTAEQIEKKAKTEGLDPFGSFLKNAIVI